MATKWDWRQSDELMKELIQIQNEPKFENRDIMTIVGFMRSESELVNHIKRHRALLD